MNLRILSLCFFVIYSCTQVVGGDDLSPTQKDASIDSLMNDVMDAFNPLDDGSGTDQADTSPPEPDLIYEIRVLVVKDGDTMDVERLSNGEQFTVRLLGVDTPEIGTASTAEIATEASNYTKNVFAQLASGSVIELYIWDESDYKDPYGRFLGEIYIQEESFNETIVANGYGVACFFPSAYMLLDRLVQPQISAILKKRKIWSLNNSTITTITNNCRPGIVAGEDFNGMSRTQMEQLPGISSTKATTLYNYIQGGKDFVDFDELASYLSYIGVTQTSIDTIESLYEKGLFVFGTPLWKK